MMESKIGFVLLLCFTGALAMHMKETNNHKLFEGDMKITTRQRILVAGRINKRGSTNDSTLLWLPNKVVPYEILPALESKAEASFAIMQGFREWESHTCLKFVRRTNQKDFLFLNTSCDGCWSWVGRQGGKQEVCLDSGCWSRATVTHELAHAMGFWHEQSRPDRDQYVKIVWENIEKDNAYNFDKNLHVNSLGSPYDCYSVMQYDKTSFSSNGRVTMQPIDSNVIQLGQEVGFTDADAIQASTLYQCNGVTTKKPFTRQVYNLDGSNDCTFENNLCHFTQSGMDDFDWTLRIGATPSWGTGPRVDHTTGRMGRLIYTEASYPRVKGEKARLMSKLFRGGTRCMTFFLHMYSKNATNMGTFNIYLKMERGSKKESLVFTRTASQGNQWIEHSITIASKTKFQIVLEGVIGNNYQGDIAVDDISFATGRCQVNTKPPPVPPATCQDINAREAAYCPAWKSAGLCDTYKDDIKHLCSKTCGFCT